MAYERHWEEAPERPISSDGGVDGSVTLSDLSGFYVKQQVTLKSNAVTSRVYQVKKIDVYNSKIFLGDVGKPIGQLSDLSDFTLADSATIKAEKQPKNTVPKDDQAQGTYETEPVVARRVVLVDEKGQKYTDDNPLPTSATLVGDSTPVEVLVLNIPLASANTDYTVAFPSNIHQFQLQIRDGKGPLRIYDTPSGPYYTVSRGSYYKSEIIRNTTLSLTVQSSLGSSVLEVLCWVRI